MKRKITVEKVNIFLIGIMGFVFIIVSGSMAVSVVSKVNAKMLEVKINNIKQNENEEKEYYVSKLKYLEISKNNINISNSNSNSNSIDDGFTKEMAFMYLEEKFKDNPNVLYTDIIDEMYINNVKYYVAKLYNKEIYETYGGGIGNTLLIAKDKNIYDYMQIMDEE